MNLLEFWYPFCLQFYPRVRLLKLGRARRAAPGVGWYIELCGGVHFAADWGVCVREFLEGELTFSGAEKMSPAGLTTL
jgi:hypothetical protein